MYDSLESYFAICHSAFKSLGFWLPKESTWGFWVHLAKTGDFVIHCTSGESDLGKGTLSVIGEDLQAMISTWTKPEMGSVDDVKQAMISCVKQEMERLDRLKEDARILDEKWKALVENQEEILQKAREGVPLPPEGSISAEKLRDKLLAAAFYGGSGIFPIDERDLRILIHQPIHESIDTPLIHESIDHQPIQELIRTRGEAIQRICKHSDYYKRFYTKKEDS